MWKPRGIIDMHPLRQHLFLFRLQTTEQANVSTIEVVIIIIWAQVG